MTDYKPVTPEWIEENMGISKKAVKWYEEKGLIEPHRNPNNNYREYDEKDLIDIWRIKTLIELGFTIEEIKKIKNDSNIDYVELINRKIQYTEVEIERLERRLGHLKYVKTSGMHMLVPQEMGTVKFEDFIKDSHSYLNVDADPQTQFVYQLVEQMISDPEYGVNLMEQVFLKLEPEFSEDEKQMLNQMLEQMDSKSTPEWSEEENHLIEKMILKLIPELGEVYKQMSFELGPELSEEDIASLIESGDATPVNFIFKLASFSDRAVSDSSVQELIKEMYVFECEHIYKEFSESMTPQRYAKYVLSYFGGSSSAILWERVLGKEKCEFIIKAIEYFGVNSSES